MPADSLKLCRKALAVLWVIIKTLVRVAAVWAMLHLPDIARLVVG